MVSLPLVRTTQHLFGRGDCTLQRRERLLGRRRHAAGPAQDRRERATRLKQRLKQRKEVQQDRLTTLPPQKSEEQETRLARHNVANISNHRTRPETPHLGPPISFHTPYLLRAGGHTRRCTTAAGLSQHGDDALHTPLHPSRLAAAATQTRSSGAHKQRSLAIATAV